MARAQAPPAEAPPPGAEAIPALPRDRPLQATRVEIRGNRRLPSGGLLTLVSTKKGRRVDADGLRADVRVLWRLGWFSDVRVEVAPVGSDVAVTFVVTEKPTIREIKISGQRTVRLARIQQVLDLRPGEIVDGTRARRTAGTIRDLYLDRGHFRAQVYFELRQVASDQVDVLFRIREGPHALVRRIEFVGNHRFTDAELRKVISTREPNLLSIITDAGTYRDDVLERDVVLLQAHYLDRGYVHARVEPPRVELSADSRSVYVIFSVVEGAAFLLGEIDATGELLEPREAVIARLRVRPGQVFNRSVLGQDVQDLTRRFKDAGYAYANVTPETDIIEASRRVDVAIDAQRGPKVYVERIEIRGNKKTRDKVIRRELRVAEGDLYSETALETSRRRVTALGFFSSVDMSTQRGSRNDRIVVTFDVVERSTGSFQAGLGFSSTESFLVHAMIGQLNLFGRGQLLTLQASFSGARRLFLLQFQDPYFLDTPWTFGFSLYDQLRAYTGFLRASTGGSLTWGYLLTDDLRVFLTYMLESVALSTNTGGSLIGVGPSVRAPPGTLANFLRGGITSSARLSLMYDTRDNRLFPIRGFLNTASAEVADRHTGSENEFTRYEATVRYFHPLGGPFVLRLRYEGGLVVSRDSRGVPLFERYFGGGIFDVRGFRAYSMGPRIRTPEQVRPDLGLVTSAIGGNLHLVANNEIEFALVQRLQLRGVVFVDAGNTFNLEDQYCRVRAGAIDRRLDPCQVSLDALRYSWGFGVRWFSPIGPLRFEWGFPLRRLPGEDPVVFEFTVGNAF